jgi:prefoldin alpha subunit
LASSDQETFRGLAVELRILEGTAEELQARLSLVTATLRELNMSRMTVEGVEKENPDASLYVPVGGGSFIKAKLESNDKIIIGIGAGVSIERSLTEAKQIIQNRISEIEKNRESIQQQFIQIANRIQEDRDRLQELSAKLNQVVRRPSVPKAERRP